MLISAAIVRERNQPFIIEELELDEPAIAAMERRDAAEAAVAQAERRVRAMLSDAVRAALPDLETLLAQLARNPDLNDLFAAYPELTIDDVKGCLSCSSAWRSTARWGCWSEAGGPC